MSHRGCTDARLLARLDALARVGADPAGGVTRPAFGPDDRAARELVGGWMADAGLDVTHDAATNLIGRRPGTDSTAPHLVLGSHLDSVPRGGHLDGAYGVVAAVEVADRLRPLRLHHGLTVVGYANEEGTDFPAFTGSRTIAGVPPSLDDRDATGRSLRDALAAADGSPGALADAAWDPRAVAAVVELHIEQGPVLEARDVTIGVVESITGQQVLELTFDGRANHAGTTPMDLRHDALTVAARVVVEAEDLGRRGGARVITVGRLEVSPGARNVVPGQVRMSVDIRDADDGRVRAATTELTHRARDLAGRAGVTATAVALAAEPAVPTDPGIRTAIEKAAAHHGYPTLRLPSGAGHDTQVMAALAPVGMIFVPSVGGVSHSPHERTSPDDLIAGLRVLHDTVVELDRTLAAGTSIRT
jgi:hydantoinase/carbamoylase family amidase